MKGKYDAFKLQDTKSEIAKVSTILDLVESLSFYVIKNERAVMDDPNVLKQLTLINNAVGEAKDELCKILGEIDIHLGIVNGKSESV